MPDDRLLHRRAGHSEKVSALTDLEYRVWTQYILSADDFGVMRAAAVKLQADNDYLATKPARAVLQALQRLITIALLHTFQHQGRAYVFQHDWQSWQKVEWPRGTNEPKPDAATLDACDEATRKLFGRHPGGESRKKHKHAPSDSERTFRENPETDPSIRAYAPAERLTANGSRLTASLGERSGEGAPLDAWFLELCSAYPAQAVSNGHLTQTAFCDVFSQDSRDPADVWRELMSNLENQIRGYQWRVKRMIPKLQNWLREGLWKQRHEEDPPVAERLSPKTTRTLSAAAEILKGRHDA